MNAYEAVEAYYALRQQHAGVKRPCRTPKKIIADAEAYLKWCTDNDVDASAFMRDQVEYHKKKRHTFFPPLRSMRSNKLLATYRKYGFEGKALESKRYDRLRGDMAAGIETMVANLQARPQAHQERLRGEYQAKQQTELCMAEHALIGGYDPRSKLCPTCPNKRRCLLNLNGLHGFDVGALRVNMLARVPAVVRNTARALRDKELLAS